MTNLRRVGVVTVALMLSLVMASAAQLPSTSRAQQAMASAPTATDGGEAITDPPVDPRMTPVLGGGAPGGAITQKSPPPHGGWDGSQRPQIFTATHHDESRSLRAMAKAAGPASKSESDSEAEREREEEERQRGTAKSTPKVDLPADSPDMVAAPVTDIPMPSATRFEGIGNVNGLVPPDTTGDIGITHYIQSVNASYAIFDRAGNRVIPPVNNKSLWQGFGGPCEQYNNGDPMVSYDELANRWVIAQFAIDDSTQNLECIAVSTTGNPTGTWYRYSFPYGTYLPDYPKLGVWPDGYYFTFNMFSKENGNFQFAGVKACAMDRAHMLVGAAATQQCFDRASEASLLPSDLDGPTAPPAGSPNYMLSENPYNSILNALTMYRFHADWDTPANSSFTGPISLTTRTYYRACIFVDREECIPQLGSSTKLESLGGRLMYRLGYRNMGSYESLVVNHTVSLTATYGLTPQTGVGWYEIRSPGTTPVVYQDGLHSPDSSLYRWMGSVAMDSTGAMALGYSTSSATTFPGIRYTGRLATDPLGTMPYAEGVIQDGGGGQETFSRWGDYSAMQVDPIDDCTFWYTSEYFKSTNSGNWSTRIASFKFPSCTGTTSKPSAPASITATASSSSITVSVTPPTSTGNLPITGYTFKASPGNIKCTTVTGTTPDALKCTFTTLAVGTDYTFTALATNGLGDGPAVGPSEPVRIGDGPGAPGAVTAVAGDTSAAISWSTAAPNGHAITSYRATASPGDAYCQTPEGAIPVPLSCNISGLTNGTTYTVTVTATNSVGTGPASASVSVTPFGLPGAPTSPAATPGDTSAVVTWAEAAANGSPVTYYRATASPGDAYCQTPAGANPVPLTCTITGLANGTTYTVTVAATNAAGTGSASTSASVTPAGLPGAPGSPNAIPGSSSATVTWTGAAANGSVVTSYRATASPGDSYCQTPAGVTPVPLSCTMTGLTNGSTYTITVRATNSVGAGPASNGVPVTPFGVPGAPTSPAATGGDSAAIVTWAAADANGSPVLRYRAIASPGGDYCQTPAGANPVPLTCTINGLDNGTKYTVTVTATNAAGTGPASASAAVTPLGAPGAPGSPAAVPGDGSAAVTWTAAPANGSPVTYYRATARPGGASCRTPAGANPVPLTCTITGLANGITYAISVTATNANGTGPNSTSTSVTPLGVPGPPGAPSAVPGDSAATVTWGAAAANGAPVTFYVATAVPGGSNCSTSGALSCTITGLANGTTYTITVTATNERGTGPSSPSAQVTPAAAVVVPPDTPVPPPATTPAQQPQTPIPPPVVPPTPVPPASLALTAAAVSNKSKIKVTVLTPCTSQYRFRLQRMASGSNAWTTLAKTYKTATKYVKVGRRKVAVKTKTVNQSKGTYRALVTGACGYADTASGPVRLKR